MKTISDLTQHELDVAASMEHDAIRGTVAPCVNSYGDLVRTPDGLTLTAGRSSVGVRVTEVIAWRRGYPRKRTLYCVTDTLCALHEEFRRRQAKQLKKENERRRQEALLDEQRRAAELGETLAEYRMTMQWIEEQCEEIARVNRENELRKEWWRVCVSLADQYDFTPREAFVRVCRESCYGSGVGRAWRSGEFCGDRYDFACRVLGAAHRHEHTAYDALLANGMDRETARERAHEYV